MVNVACPAADRGRPRARTARIVAAFLGLLLIGCSSPLDFHSEDVRISVEDAPAQIRSDGRLVLVSLTVLIENRSTKPLSWWPDCKGATLFRAEDPDFRVPRLCFLDSRGVELETIPPGEAETIAFEIGGPPDPWEPAVDGEYLLELLLGVGEPPRTVYIRSLPFWVTLEEEGLNGQAHL